MSVLVVGGAGYIGSHTVRELQKSGKEVVVYDNLSKGYRDAVNGYTLVVGDLLDQKCLMETIEKYQVDSVIHFAAFIEVGESMTDPEKYYLNNVSGTLSLLQVMRKTGVNRIVFSSTAAVYGEPEEVPITERCPKHPSSVYGNTKWMMEQILRDYDMAYGLKYTALRYFNACGAHVDGSIGEAHTPESHLIPIILQVLLGQREKVFIFGDDYDTPDGTCVRDYIHVTDLASAHVLSLKRLENGGSSTAYNLGNGNGFSVKEVIATVEKVTGEKVKVEMAKRRPGDPAVLIAGSKRAMEELHWKPEYQSLDKIIETAWSWHKNHPNGYR